MFKKIELQKKNESVCVHKEQSHFDQTREYNIDFKEISFQCKNVNDFIKTRLEGVIKSRFKIETYFSASRCEDCLTDERLNEIKIYRDYDLVSPIIYDLISWLLVNNYHYNKSKIFDELEPYAEKQIEKNF